jgi:hypothetical protein
LDGPYWARTRAKAKAVKTELEPSVAPVDVELMVKERNLSFPAIEPGAIYHVKD